jgi:hypothetical protein
MPPVRAERKPEPLGRGFLLECGVEMGESKDPAQFVVACADGQRRSRLRGSAFRSADRWPRATSKRERISGLSARRSRRR